MLKQKNSELLDISSVTLSDVIDLDFLQKFQDNFAKGMGLASITVDDKGNAVTKPSCYTEFCINCTNSTKVGEDRCAESHRKGGEEAVRTGKPAIYHCHAGLIDFAAPIILEGRQLGTILGGQILDKSPELEQFKQIAREIGVDPDKYVEAVNKVQIKTKEGIQAAAEVLFMVANNLSRIGYMVYFDLLTGLPNRRQLNEWLDKEIELAQRGHSSGFVLFIDLDDLKMVNDTYGHTCGDKIIIEAGARIAAAVGEDAFVSRVGGDEFIVILHGRTDTGMIDEIAHRVIKALVEKHEISGMHFHMTASVGIVAYPADGATAEEIIKNADNAMYAAKRDGKNCWRFYTKVMQDEAYEKMLLINSLHYAAECGELSLVYQPQISTIEGTVSGFEALLRWNNPEHGVVSPVQFIPLAEQSGIIHTIGKWVLRKACQFARRLSDLGWNGVHVAVNISAKQLATDNFIDDVRSAVKAAGIQPCQLELEITETLLMTSLEVATSKLAELKGFGVRVSLDDFGTGYSSLTYLRKLPVDTLKIDKTFTDRITVDANSSEIMGSIINMAHILNMMVVAEGVETEQQLTYLTVSGCDLIQGYIFSRPVPESEAIEFLNKRKNYGDRFLDSNKKI